MRTNRLQYRSAAPVMLLALIAIGSRAPADPATRPATAPHATSLQSIASLYKSAVSDDPTESLAALRQLAVAGGAGQAALREVVRQLLARDAGAVEAEAAVAPAELPKLRAAEAEADPLRAGARSAVEKLTHDPAALKAARQNYDRLSAVQVRLSAGYLRQARVVRALDRRAECLALLRPPETAPVAPGEGERLGRLAEQVLGMPADVAAGFTRGAPEPPKESARRGLWFYLSCRRIEAYNRTIEPGLNAAEVTHARRLNFYRELLGLLPYELDPRLTQSARRHSKEMVDLWYFSHYSPTESERDPWRRMEGAGYAEGSNENLTMGSWNGEEAFWRLFNSPGHHRAWIAPADTALGVGKWENAWTEDIGAGPRLMTAHPDERAKAVVVGDELKPQAVEATRRHPRDLKDVKFYDPAGREVGKAAAALDPKERAGAKPGTEKPGNAGNAGGVEVEVKDPKGGTTIHWGVGHGATGPS